MDNLLPINILLTSKSFGLIQDAMIYNKYIINSSILDLTENTNININKNYIALILEYIDYKNDKLIKLLNNADKIIFMVNIDLFYPSIPASFYNKIDMFVCKTKFTRKCMKKIFKNDILNKTKLYYTKHTSIFIDKNNKIQSIFDNSIKKNFKMFLHSAGKSPFKNTSEIVKTWMNNNFPPIYITCYDSCLRNFKKYEHYDKNKRYYESKNIFFINNKIDDEKLITLKNTCGIHICPSYKEGYGHYINEARQTKSVCVTIDGSPFNELINDDNGYLIDYSEKRINKTNFSNSYLFDINALANVIKEILNTDDNILIQKGINAYNDYLNDNNYCKRKLKKIRSNFL